MADNRRLTIPSSEEILSLYNLPKFNDDNRKLYFDLSAAESDAVHRVHTTAVVIHLALQLGYFKAKQRFFSYETDQVGEDYAYLVKRYFPDKNVLPLKVVSKPTQLEQQKLFCSCSNTGLQISLSKTDW